MLFAAMLMLCFAASVAAHKWAEQYPAPSWVKGQVMVVPPSPVLIAASLGNRTLLADLYYIRALQYFGDHRNVRDGLFVWLSPLLHAVTDLDPGYRSAYRMAGLAMTISPPEGTPNAKQVLLASVLASNDLLAKGQKNLPDDWELAFIHGFNNFYFLCDFAEAGRLFTLAAGLPDAPSFVAGLGTRVLADVGREEQALEFLDEVIAHSEEGELRETLQEKRKRVLLMQQLRSLREAVHLYEQRFARPPTTLQELVDHRILRALPDEPFGGQYVLKDGEVQSSIHGTAKKEWSVQCLQSSR